MTTRNLARRAATLAPDQDTLRSANAQAGAELIREEIAANGGEISDPILVEIAELAWTHKAAPIGLCGVIVDMAGQIGAVRGLTKGGIVDIAWTR